MALVDKDANNKTWRLQAAGNVAGDPVRFFSNDGVVSQGFNTTTGWTINTWHLAVGVVTSATSRTVYIDGGSSASGSTSVNPSADIDRVAIGNRGGTDNEYFTGDIAEAFIYSGGLSASELASLAGGLSPLSVNVANLVFYAPLYGDDSPEPDLIGGLNLTVSGATKSAHPFIYHPGSAAVASFSSLNAKDSPPFKGDKSYSQFMGRNPTYVDRSRQLRGITIEYGGEK